MSLWSAIFPLIAILAIFFTSSGRYEYFCNGVKVFPTLRSLLKCIPENFDLETEISTLDSVIPDKLLSVLRFKGAKAISTLTVYIRDKTCKHKGKELGDKMSKLKSRTSVQELRQLVCELGPECAEHFQNVSRRLVKKKVFFKLVKNSIEGSDLSPFSVVEAMMAAFNFACSPFFLEAVSFLGILPLPVGKGNWVEL